MLEHFLARPGGIPGVVLVGFLVTLTAVSAVFQLREAIAEENYSAASVVAAMLTFALASAAVLGSMTVASAGGVVLVAVLASRDFLHASMRKLRWSELRSAVILLALTFVILPIVPAEPVGPFGGISPSKSLIMVSPGCNLLLRLYRCTPAWQCARRDCRRCDWRRNLIHGSDDFQRQALDE